MRFGKRWIAFILTVAMLGCMGPVFALEPEKTVAFIDNWTYNVYSEDAGVIIDTSEDAMGKASLKLWNNMTRDKEATFVRLDIPAVVEANKRYYLEFDLKLKNARNIYAMFDGTQHWLIPYGSKTADWSHYKLYFDSPTSKTMLVKFGVLDYTEGMWIDNLKYYAEDNPGVNLLSRSNFEDLTASNIPKEEAPRETEGTLDISKYTICYSTDQVITVDGNPEEWANLANIEPVPILDQVDLLDHEEAEFSADVKFTWNDEGFYYLVTVQDPIHSAINNASTYWMGDGIQFNATYDTQNPNVEMGVSFDPTEGWHCQNRDIFESGATRVGTTDYYEVFVPWKWIVTEGRPSVLRTNVLVNNNNGDGRQEYVEITPGIGQGKDTSVFNYYLLVREVGEVLYAEYVPSQLGAKTDSVGSIFFRNLSGSNQTVEVEVEELNFKQSTTVPAGELGVVDIQNVKGVVGDLDFNITVKNNGDEVVLPYNIFIPYGVEEYNEFMERLNGWTKELKNLVQQCKDKGMLIPYEEAYYTMFPRYIEIIEGQGNKADFKYMHMYDEDMTMIYEETKEALQAYLNREKEPQKVPLYVTSDIKYDGIHLVANTFDGEKYAERPIFLTGFGHFDTAREDFTFFSNLGFNINENETSFAGIMTDKKPTAYPWDQGTMGGGTGTSLESNEEAASGNWSVKFDHPEGQWGKSTWTNYVPKVEPNTTYEYSFKTKGTIKGETSMYFSPHGMWGAQKDYIKSSDKWVTHTGTYTTGPDQTKLEMHFMCNDQAEIFLDDFALKRKGSSLNLVENGDFELGGRELYGWEQELLDEYGIHIRWKGLMDMKRALEDGARNNVVILLAANSHYMPTWLYDMSDGSYKKATDSVFAPWTVNNDFLPKMFSYNAKAMLSIAEGYENTYAMSITNEPTAKSHFEIDWYTPDFQEYLKEVHGTIENLNATYGEGYNFKSFEEIKVPKGTEPTPLFSDYRKFNDKQLTKFLGDYAAHVREEFPQYLYGTKIMMSLSHNHDGYLLQGTNMEYLADVFDINGSDSFSQHNTTPVSLKMAWYDYLRSIRDVPIACWEGHVTGDSPVVADDPTLEYKFEADIWNGAAHGKTSSVMWLWDGTEEFIRFAHTDMAYRPDCLYRIVKGHMDINRLADELVALHDNAPSVGLRYSRMSGGYNTNYGIELQQVYEELRNTGYRSHFVTEYNMEEMHDQDVLVIFGSPHVTKEYLAEMKTYVENGGKIVLVGSGFDNLYDDYDRPHDAETVRYIFDNAIFVEEETDLSDKIHEISPNKIQLVDAKTSENLNNMVEWIYTEYEGNYLVHICNFDPYNDVEVKVLVDGKEIDGYEELRYMNEGTGSNLLLGAQRPIFLQIAK